MLLNTGLSRVGGAIRELLTNRDQMLGAVGLTAGVAISVYSAKEGFALARSRLEAILGRPTLVRQTSRNATIFERIRALVAKSNEEELIKGVILHPKIEERVRSLSDIVRATKKHGADFRHVMFWGPPGTGKTLVARKLALQSGLDYAIMSGGDVGPLKSDAVTEIHKLFQWAEASPKGLMLFIDEVPEKP